MTFGEKLQKLRKEKGWTQEELAGHIHISRQALSKWELGTAIPDTENVVQISKLFHVSTDYLLNDDYESDQDIPAVCLSNQKLSDYYSGRIRMIIGACISGISLLSLLILGILSSVSPAVVTESPATMEWTRTYTGLLGFLMFHNLGWLFVLLLITTVIGIAVICYPKLKPFLSRHNNK